MLPVTLARPSWIGRTVIRIGMRCLGASLCLASTAATVQAQWFSFGSTHPDAAVVLTGGYRFVGQTADRQGTFQDRPEDLWRMEFNPTLSIVGVPITANILVSSEQRGIRQDIDAFSLTLDPAVLERMVMARATNALRDVYNSAQADALRTLDEKRDSLQQSNPEQLATLDAYKQVEQVRDGVVNVHDAKDALQRLGIMSKAEYIVSLLPTVGIGAIYPSFTPLTLNGIRLQGGSLEWNPGGTLYVHAATGTTQRPITRLDTVRLDSSEYTTFDNSAFGRDLHALRLGFGRKDGAHLFLTGLWAQDDPASQRFGDSTVTVLTPQRNVILGVDMRVEPIPGIWVLQAEVAGSANVANLNAPAFATDAVPPWVLGIVDSSLTAYGGLAGAVTTTLNLRSTGTRFTGSYRQIGPGYRSLGVPNLRTDLLRYDVRLDQSAWKRQVTGSVFYRRDHDNLIPWKRSTTSVTSLGVSLGLNIRKLPFLRLTYAPYVQENSSVDTALQFRNTTSQVMGAMGYSYRLGSMGASSSLNVARQWTNTKNQQADNSVQSINVTQSLSWQFPLTVSGGLGLIQQEATGAASTTITMVDVSASYVIADLLTASGGLTLAFESEASTRSGFYLNANMALWDAAVIDLHAERTLFDERRIPPILGGSYNETLVRLTISKYW